ncbi:hypothetical protein, partial [Klebsiella pneumoniae]|uniref:hypothetical protein n=1 Tax=Klebsiella pneumoniae TaxID=573 RepID=UPI00405558FB
MKVLVGQRIIPQFLNDCLRNVLTWQRRDDFVYHYREYPKLLFPSARRNVTNGDALEVGWRYRRLTQTVEACSIRLNLGTDLLGQ